MSNDPASGGDQHGRHGQSPYPGAYGQPGDQPAYPGVYGSHAEPPGSGYPGYQATQQAGYGQPPPQWGQAAASQPGWQGAQPAGSGPGGVSGGAGTPNVFGALFDLGFNSFATPVVIKVLYVLGLVVVGLGYLGFVVTAFATGVGYGLLVLLLGAVVALFYLIFLRVTLEFYFAVVRMAEDIRQMRNRSSL